MGQKVNPIGFRLVVNRDWRSKWYASGKDFTDKLHEDLRVRKYISERLHFAALSKVIIERAWNSVRVTLHTSRPGLVIGRKGSEIERMTNDLTKVCSGSQVKIDIVEVRTPELDAQLVAENVAVQLERRISFRRAMKRAVQTTMDFGAEGIRIRCAGRLGGADIARAEWYRKGKVPLQTLRVPIDYGFTEAKTVYGIIGVKCWINRKEEDPNAPTPPRPRRDGNRRPGGRPGGPGGRPGGPGGPGGGRGPGGPGGRGPGGPGGPGGGRGPGGPGGPGGGRGPGGPGGPGGGRGPGGPGGRGPGVPGRGPGGPGAQGGGPKPS
jgi:small subunit ribosomal protein S3